MCVRVYMWRKNVLHRGARTVQQSLCARVTGFCIYVARTVASASSLCTGAHIIILYTACIPMIYLYIIVYSYCSTEYKYIYNAYRFMRCVYTLHDEIHPLWRNPSGTGRRVCKIYIILCCVMCISHV